MSQATDYLENKLITALSTLGSIDLSDGTITNGTGGFIGLFTTAPDDTGAATEVSGGSYARVQIGAQGQGTMGVNAGSCQNQQEFRFPDSTGNWGTIVAVGLFDAATNGNALVYGTLTSSVQIGTGEIFKIPVNGFTITLS